MITWLFGLSKTPCSTLPVFPARRRARFWTGVNKAGASHERNFGVMHVKRDTCVDPIVAFPSDVGARGGGHGPAISRRQVTDLALGQTTMDDFGSDGDDTARSAIPYYPAFYSGIAGLSAAGCTGVANGVFADLQDAIVLFSTAQVLISI